jgi:Flp pilus assembly protein TadD
MPGLPTWSWIASSVQRPGRLPLATAIVIGSLFAGTSAAVAWYHAERAERARAHVESGRRLVDQGRLPQAVAEFRAALLLERGDPETEQALAFTLQQLGRFEESESYLRDLLQRDPANGPLNLALARIRAATPDGDARRLYQRAIYGEWPDAQSLERLTARFELAAYLRKSGSREELLAELLRLKAEVAADDVVSARRLADLFVGAGDAQQAIAVMHTAADAAPSDVALLEQLAATEADAGLPVAARRTLRRALALQPQRTDLRERLAIVDRVLALHPALPNLRLTTRTRRARDLLAAVVAETESCAAGDGAAGGLRRAAQTRLSRRDLLTAEAAEENLSTATELWTAATSCRSRDGDAEAIARVIDDLVRLVEAQG